MLLVFAKPLLDRVEDPPTAKRLQGILNIAVEVWNLPLYEKAKACKRVGISKRS